MADFCEDIVVKSIDGTLVSKNENGEITIPFLHLSREPVRKDVEGFENALIYIDKQIFFTFEPAPIVLNENNNYACLGYIDSNIEWKLKEHDPAISIKSEGVEVTEGNGSLGLEIAADVSLLDGYGFHYPTLVVKNDETGKDLEVPVVIDKAVPLSVNAQTIEVNIEWILGGGDAEIELKVIRDRYWEFVGFDAISQHFGIGRMNGVRNSTTKLWLRDDYNVESTAAYSFMCVSGMQRVIINIKIVINRYWDVTPTKVLFDMGSAVRKYSFTITRYNRRNISLSWDFNTAGNAAGIAAIPSEKFRITRTSPQEIQDNPAKGEEVTETFDLELIDESIFTASKCGIYSRNLKVTAEGGSIETKTIIVYLNIPVRYTVKGLNTHPDTPEGEGMFAPDNPAEFIQGAWVIEKDYLIEDADAVREGAPVFTYVTHDIDGLHNQIIEVFSNGEAFSVGGSADGVYGSPTKADVGINTDTRIYIYKKDDYYPLRKEGNAASGNQFSLTRPAYVKYEYNPSGDNGNGSVTEVSVPAYTFFFDWELRCQHFLKTWHSHLLGSMGFVKHTHIFTNDDADVVLNNSNEELSYSLVTKDNHLFDRSERLADAFPLNTDTNVEEYTVDVVSSVPASLADGQFIGERTITSTKDVVVYTAYRGNVIVPTMISASQEKDVYDVPSSTDFDMDITPADTGESRGWELFQEKTRAAGKLVMSASSFLTQWNAGSRSGVKTILLHFDNPRTVRSYCYSVLGNKTAVTGIVTAYCVEADLGGRGWRVIDVVSASDINSPEGTMLTLADRDTSGNPVPANNAAINYRSVPPTLCDRIRITIPKTNKTAGTLTVGQFQFYECYPLINKSTIAASLSQQYNDTKTTAVKEFAFMANSSLKGDTSLSAGVFVGISPTDAVSSISKSTTWRSIFNAGIFNKYQKQVSIAGQNQWVSYLGDDNEISVTAYPDTDARYYSYPLLKESDSNAREIIPYVSTFAGFVLRFLKYASSSVSTGIRINLKGIRYDTPLYPLKSFAGSLLIEYKNSITSNNDSGDYHLLIVMLADNYFGEIRRNASDMSTDEYLLNQSVLSGICLSIYDAVYGYNPGFVSAGTRILNNKKGDDCVLYYTGSQWINIGKTMVLNLDSDTIAALGVASIASGELTGTSEGIAKLDALFAEWIATTNQGTPDLNEKYVTFHNPYDQHRIMRNGPGNWTDLGEFKMSDTLGIYRHRELNQPDVMSMRISVPGLTNIFSKKPYESLSVQLGDIQLFHLFKEYETAFAEVIIDGYRTARIFHNEMYDAANEGVEYNVGFPPKEAMTVFNAGRNRSVQIVSLLVDGMDYKLKHPDYAALLSEYYYLYSSYQSNINNNLLEVSRVTLPASGDTTVSMPSPGCNMLSCTWNKPSGAVAAVPDTENFLMPFLPVPLLLTS